jgi:hypothetical protein
LRVVFFKTLQSPVPKVSAIHYNWRPKGSGLQEQDIESRHPAGLRNGCPNQATISGTPASPL